MTKKTTSPKVPKQTKKAKLIELLSGSKPISLDKLSSALGWLRHTTRAAVTRLRQEGLEVQSIKNEDSARTYHISSASVKGTDA